MDKHISDDDGFFTDEEDEEWSAPITAAWGVPSTEQEFEVAEENDGFGDVNSWHHIADPNAKLRADGRLGKPVPKKAQAKPITVHTKPSKISMRPVSGSKPILVISAPGAGKKGAKKARQASLAIAAERARAVEMAAARQRPPSKEEDVQVQSTWATGASLVTTPFWEQSSSMASKYAQQSMQQQQQQQHQHHQQQHRQQQQQQHVEAQKRKPSRAPPITQTQKPTPAPAPAPGPQPTQKFGTQIKGLSESMKKLELARAASAFQPSRSSTKPVSSGRVIEIIPPKSALPEIEHTPKATIPSSKSNPLPPKSAAKVEPVKPSRPRQPTSFAPAKAPAPTQAPAPAPAPKPKATTSTKEISSAHSKWANPAAVPAAILFTLNIELEKGETMPITVRENDDPRQLAVAFVERYQKRSSDGSSVNNNNVVEALTHLIQQQIKIKSGKA
ncbi:unnamed protein product [Umbelopsis ramanniana]